MRRDLVVRPEAEAELAEAFDWYNDRVPGLGSDFLLNVDASIHAIHHNPLHFPVIYNDLRRALIRRFPYQIFYVVEERTIVIIGVFHVKRSSRRWKARRSQIE